MVDSNETLNFVCEEHKFHGLCRGHKSKRCDNKSKLAFAPAYFVVIEQSTYAVDRRGYLGKNGAVLTPVYCTIFHCCDQGVNSFC